MFSYSNYFYRGVTNIRQNYFTMPDVKPSWECYHHQPINVFTAGAQAFLMDHPLGEQAITHHAGPVRIGGNVIVYEISLRNTDLDEVCLPKYLSRFLQ
jgi:hypothetical protein